ncbi:protein DpdG [Paraburkholderia domus]|uniref:Uncharacterized protein n=1 Tax=Paraburkholderia domus TaxID=2793075 RepID=A0A9N8QWH2_9BURK|nr:protein DpdG [Paraburkholderia domus]MBK5163800.1 hypothetical protein [Burkholderia sp. R-70211]CAE6858464.1 hypothetical protein R70211_00312 [Paraburkholderia domus]
MSILNLQSDGLPSIMLTLARIAAQDKPTSRDDLLGICVPQSGITKDTDKDLAARARATLVRWTNLGLFAEDRDQVRLSVGLTKGESIDAFTARLPEVCRELALRHENGLPLWATDGSVSEEATGRTADFCRGLAWCLAQDIYTLPNSHAEIESLVTSQVQAGRFIFLNDTRWAGFRTWARFLGCATGDDSSFFCDATPAVRWAFSQIMHTEETLAASAVISRLAECLPVIDSGVYRQEVEQTLKPETWKKPAPGHLSTSLSFALQRLHKQKTIQLTRMADASSQLTLVGQGGRTWESFTHVRLTKDAS